MPSYALTDRQHDQFSRLVAADEEIVRGEAPQKVRRQYPGIARVVCIDTDSMVYSPLTTRPCAVFRRNVLGSQKTLQFVGQNLEGDLVLTLAGVEYQVPCTATTSELRAILGLQLKDCRTTVFPGLWEFDFNQGKWAESPPAFSVEPFEPPDDDTETPIFDGGMIVTDEGWVSCTEDGDTFVTIDTEDWIPYLTGSVKPGSIGGAIWCHEAGWLVVAWQCREFSFKGAAY